MRQALGHCRRLETVNDLPQDIRLWLLTAHPKTEVLERNVPLPVSHDALRRGLVRNDTRGMGLKDRIVS